MGKNKEINRLGIVLLGIGLIVLIIGLVLSIIIFLPQKIPIRYEYSSLTIDIMGHVLFISQEQRLAILVILSGALGSTLHAATSFSKHLGWGRLSRGWIWWYLLRPFVGGMLALVVYFAIRGGLLVNNSGAESLNLFGIVALAAMSGMFARHAIDKLGVLFTKVFNTPEKPTNEREPLKNLDEK